MSDVMTSLFGSSPISPLQKHMSKVQECIEELIPFFDAALSQEWKTATKHQQKIAKKENEADELKKALRLNLPKGLFMPVSRRDLLEVLTMQDRIANKAKDIAGIIIGRQMVFPKGTKSIMMKFIKRCVDASAQAKKAINELDELVETGFRGKEVKLVASMIKKLDKIESDTDDIQVDIRFELFKKEQDLPAVDVMFLYKVIEWVGDLADISQRVGSRLELMLAK
ncbi:MAG: TIGR00153 family protein [Thiohalomonadales bacterium]